MTPAKEARALVKAWLAALRRRDARNDWWTELTARDVNDLVARLAPVFERAARAETELKEVYHKLEFALQFVHTSEGLFTFPDGDIWKAGSKADEYCPTEPAYQRALVELKELERQLKGEA